MLILGNIASASLYSYFIISEKFSKCQISCWLYRKITYLGPVCQKGESFNNGGHLWYILKERIGIIFIGGSAMILSFIYYWVTSLSIFWPPVFIRFVIGTVKNLAQVYRALATRFWWIVPIFFGFLMMSPSKTSLLYGWLFVLYFSYVCIWIFLSLLASRATIGAKSYGYFRKYVRNLFYFVFMGILLCLMVYGSLMLPSYFKIKGANGYLLATFPIAFAASWFFFACLFYIDTHKEPVKSTWRGFKMAFNNYPICWVLTNVCYALAYILYKIYIILPKQLSIFISWKLIKVFMMVFFSFIFLTIMFVPIIACIFAQLYDKKVTEQHTLYFGKR